MRLMQNGFNKQWSEIAVLLTNAATNQAFTAKSLNI